MTFRHRAGVSPYTSPFGLAETCVFGKQSPGPFHCGHLSMAPLLPKLRGYFAEFLNNSSLAHLRILSSSTCVGLRYGLLANPYTFSRHHLDLLPYLISVAYARRICLPGSLTAWTRSTNGVLNLSFCVPTSFMQSSVVQEYLPVVHRLQLSLSA